MAPAASYGISAHVASVGVRRHGPGAPSDVDAAVRCPDLLRMIGSLPLRLQHVASLDNFCSARDWAIVPGGCWFRVSPLITRFAIRRLSPLGQTGSSPPGLRSSLCLPFCYVELAKLAHGNELKSAAF